MIPSTKIFNKGIKIYDFLKMTLEKLMIFQKKKQDFRRSTTICNVL